MGQKLRAFFFTFFLCVSIFLIGGTGSVSKAQISIQNDAPLEVRFSQGESERTETSLTISLSEIESILSSEYTLSSGEWQPYDEAGNGVNYFISGGNNGTAPGRIQLKNSPYQTLFVASINNNSDYSYGNVVVAFDFIYNFFENESAHDYQLRYRVNDGEWNNLPTGFIGKSSFRSTEDTWSSFSVHLNIDDIYLRPSDTIHLMWTIEEEQTISDRIPLALQRMEIFPERVEQNTLSRGDLIITEILPVSNINGSEFEYIEVYNPSETSVSLKGVEFVTDVGVKVIQQDIFVQPYDYAVISNVDISSVEGVNNSYFYTGSIIKPDGGRVELERDGSLIASATYEPTEPGVSLELNRVSQAYDGYSSMQSFSASQLSYFQDLYGSPGIHGNTSPMFKKTLNQSGVFLLSFPGSPIQRLNRNSSLEFYSLDGTQLDIASIEPHRPVLARKTTENPITLYAEASGNVNTKPDLSTRFTSNSQFLSTAVNNRSTQLEKQSISQAFPVTQVWNAQQNKFNLKLIDQIQSDYWSPLVVNSSVANIFESSETPVRSPLPNRFIEFGVIPENQEGSTLSDVVMLGFMDVPAQYDQIRYDLPKISLEEPPSSVNIESSQLLYLTSTLSDESFNSFTHLPQEISKEYEIGLGHQVSDDAGGAILRWKMSDDIPDEWVITLEDTYDGTSVNLREENEYRFRYTNSSDVNKQDILDSPKLSTITPSERPRFVVNIQPYESFNSVSEEEEVPNSVELRPNYPNPFNPSTNINFYLPEERTVRVGVYNIVGQQVALLLDDVVQQGEHSLVWDASDKPSGIYIVQLETGSRIFTRKITLIK
jgi:hypothetical protein